MSEYVVEIKGYTYYQYIPSLFKLNIKLKVTFATTRQHKHGCRE